MGDVDKARLRMALAGHYAAQREPADPRTVDDLVQAMVAEAKRAHVPTSRMGAAAFVASQVCYIPAWTWAAQLALVAFMAVCAGSSGGGLVVKMTVGVLSAASVLIGVPTLHASKLHGVAELEYSCPRNVAEVLLARMAILGCSAALAVACMVGLASSAIDASAFAVALWACPPFFCACAGSLVLLRRVSPSAAATCCIAWVLACCAVLLGVAMRFPQAYGDAALAVWGAAALVALAWMVRETLATLRDAAAGFDSLAPHMARTNN